MGRIWDGWSAFAVFIYSAFGIGIIKSQDGVLCMITIVDRRRGNFEFLLREIRGVLQHYFLWS